jgi:molybdopterin synthase sulfur carrier subunit
MIRVILPVQLCTLANVNREIKPEAKELSSISSVLDVLEEQLPMLRGTIRDQVSQQRRPFIRFFACGEDLSQSPLSSELPKKVLTGEEPLRVVGAMAGG